MEIYQLINNEFGTSYETDYEIDLSYIFEKRDLSESFLEKIVQSLSSSPSVSEYVLTAISSYQNLSEDFMRRHSDIWNWRLISKYQILSEDFIEEFSDKVAWVYISAYQCLSERFIDKHEDDLSLATVFERQKLSESFIRKCYFSKFCVTNISIHQKISENFIERNSSLIDLDFISKYQPLSESFMERNFKHLNLLSICFHQKLSDEFIERHKDELILKYIKDNWIYKSAEEKKRAVIDTGKYECHDDYFIAYKAVRPDRYSLYNFQYKYEKGGVYESWCDCSKEDSSFGLSIGTEKYAKEYGAPSCRYKVIRCKIKYEDVGRIVHDFDKIRCFKIEVLD